MCCRVSSRQKLSLRGARTTAQSWKLRCISIKTTLICWVLSFENTRSFIEERDEIDSRSWRKAFVPTKCCRYERTFNDNNQHIRRNHTNMKERVQTIVLMRHGVAAHNFQGADLNSPSLFDPALTQHGKMAAVQAGDKVKLWWQTARTTTATQSSLSHVTGDAISSGASRRIELIVSSPLTRCLQTTFYAFGVPGDDYQSDAGYNNNHQSSSTPPILCVESLREACGKHYPDQRRPKSELEVGLTRLVQLAEVFLRRLSHRISHNLSSVPSTYCISINRVRNIGQRFDLIQP